MSDDQLTKICAIHEAIGKWNTIKDLIDEGYHEEARGVSGNSCGLCKKYYGTSSGSDIFCGECSVKLETCNDFVNGFRNAEGRTEADKIANKILDYLNNLSKEAINE